MNIALRNVPEDLHAELKAAAKRNHRSLNGEILARLALLRPGAARDVQELLERNRALLERITERQKAIGKIDFDPGMIREMRDSGRP